MSMSAWIMFLIGAGIIWGGLVVSLFIALRKKGKNDQTNP